MPVVILAVLCGCAGRSLATATVKEPSGVQFHVLTPGAGQEVQTAGYDFGTADTAVLDSLGSLPTIAPLAGGTDAGDADDGFLHDPPRSRMKKWFLAILLVGGLIRYLTSPSYAKFVSDVLSPLNW
jgi:hypothetical protein